MSPCASDAPYQYVHSLIMRSVSAALKRFVFVVTHAVMNPPYDPPVTPIFVESTSGALRRDVDRLHEIVVVLAAPIAAARVRERPRSCRSIRADS